MAIEAAPTLDLMLDQITVMLERATSLEELREMLLAAFPDLSDGDLARVLASGMMVANLAGREAEAGGTDG